MKLLPALLLLSCPSTHQVFEIQPPPYDVLVIVLDDVARFDYDSVPTPRMDELAARGVFLDQFLAMPWCQPTRATMVTGGLDFTAHGSPCSPPASNTMSPAPEHLPRLFSSAGYETALGGKWHLGLDGSSAIQNNLDSPLGWYDEWFAGIPDNLKGICVPASIGKSYNRWLRVEDGVGFEETTYQPEVLLDESVAWWSVGKLRDAPLLLVSSSQLAHSAGAGGKNFHVPPPSWLEGYVVPTPTTDRDAYEAMIVALDTFVGRLVDEVDLARTVVVIFGDNGTPVGAEHPTQDPSNVKHSTHHHGVHVPAIVLGVGVPEGVVVDQVCGVADILPTLWALAGSPVDLDVYGQSLVPAFHGQTLEREVYVVGTERDDDYAAVGRVGGVLYKLRRDQGFEALYDLDADPSEVVPLNPDFPTWAPVTAILRPPLYEALGI